MVLTREYQKTTDKFNYNAIMARGSLAEARERLGPWVKVTWGGIFKDGFQAAVDLTGEISYSASPIGIVRNMLGKDDVPSSKQTLWGGGYKPADGKEPPDVPGAVKKFQSGAKEVGKAYKSIGTVADKEDFEKLKAEAAETGSKVIEAYSKQIGDAINFVKLAAVDCSANKTQYENARTQAVDRKMVSNYQKATTNSYKQALDVLEDVQKHIGHTEEAMKTAKENNIGITIGNGASGIESLKEQAAALRKSLEAGFRTVR